MPPRIPPIHEEKPKSTRDGHRGSLNNRSRRYRSKFEAKNRRIIRDKIKKRHRDESERFLVWTATESAELFWILFAFFNVIDDDDDDAGGRWRSSSNCSSSNIYHLLQLLV